MFDNREVTAMRAARMWVLMPLFLCLGGPAVFNESARTAAPIRAGSSAVVKNEVAFEARLEDQSVVRVRLLCEQIHVSTPYGRLSVPVQDVRRIEFGHHPPAGVRKRISEAIGQLSARTFEERETASKQLLTFGPLSYTALQDATKAADIEVIRRAKSLLQKLESRHAMELLHRRWYDLVHTPTFVIAGKIEGDSLKVKTSYFGETQLRLSDLWLLRSLGNDSVITLTVDSARYANPGAAAWMETMVDVASGATLRVTAGGQIDMYPIGADAGMWMATPSGPQWVGGRGGFMAAQLPGTLVGRIGKSGKEFMISDRFSEKVNEGGRLYLRIVPSPWGNASTGEYKVSITIN
jgi:hypothetical protein